MAPISTTRATAASTHPMIIGTSTLSSLLSLPVPVLISEGSVVARTPLKTYEAHCENDGGQDCVAVLIEASPRHSHVGAACGRKKKMAAHRERAAHSPAHVAFTSASVATLKCGRSPNPSLLFTWNALAPASRAGEPSEPLKASPTASVVGPCSGAIRQRGCLNLRTSRRRCCQRHYHRPGQGQSRWARRRRRDEGGDRARQP
mmetsp:Transcript_24503/g.73396  ORF Transcript_24503/g.73396 Transcript_24503/m.73396 type:complete len:203 (+) Transcript_24503:1275-1883(+)